METMSVECQRECDLSVSTNNGVNTQLQSDWLVDLALPDLSWIANTQQRYASILQKLPDVFAWSNSIEMLDNLKVLERSVALTRFRSSMDHIRRYEPRLEASMKDSFTRLPIASRLRLLLAPETHYRILNLRKDPASSVIWLCNFLNGECAKARLEPLASEAITALGDFYELSVRTSLGLVDEGEAGVSPGFYQAPMVAHDRVVVDFTSLNTRNNTDIASRDRSQVYSASEEVAILRRLNEALDMIERVSAPAFHIIKDFVKVIMPLKTPNGGGSTSQPRIPGRVLLRGIENNSSGWLASSLVHEATHQVIYILEYAGRWVLEDVDAKAATAKSLWTGRDLPLHSFIHACFVWYGLTNFWSQAQNTAVFEPSDVKSQLEKAKGGFLKQNPIEVLDRSARFLRHDVMRSAGSLHARIQQLDVVY